MPDHADLLVLVFHDEFQFLASACILPGCEQSVYCNQTVAGEDPVVLRAPLPPRRPISCNNPATDPIIAYPCLIECYVRPVECDVHRLIGSMNSYRCLIKIGIVI